MKQRRLLNFSQDNPDESGSEVHPAPMVEQLEAECLGYQKEIKGLKKQVHDLKAEVVLLQTTPQHLDVMMLKSEELFMYTRVNCAVFEILLGWILPAIHHC